MSLIGGYDAIRVLLNRHQHRGKTVGAIDPEFFKLELTDGRVILFYDGREIIEFEEAYEGTVVVLYLYLVATGYRQLAAFYEQQCETTQKANSEIYDLKKELEGCKLANEQLKERLEVIQATASAGSEKDG